MINEWIREHKRLAVLIGAGVMLLLGLGIALVLSGFQNNTSGEEDEMTASVVVSNINVLYGDFSDYTIGYLLNAINAALLANQSMQNGSPASDNKTPAVDATNDDLYPTINQGNYTLTVKDNKIDSFEDGWGMWKTFTLNDSDGRSFKVDVALGAYDRTNDVGYTKINVTKL
jgi:hypothetical protein